MKRFSIIAGCVIGGAVLWADTIEVTAENVKGDLKRSYAQGSVVVYYNNAVLRADEAIYDKDTHKLTLDGHIEMIGYQGSKEQAAHIEIDTQTNEVRFKELFYTNANDIWLLTRYANRKEGIYEFGPSVLSSCDIHDPTWKLKFASSRYDSGEKYMKVYDTTLYLWDIPVFYTPYLAFSTDNRRKSGLLFPKLGYTAEDGFVYEQPVFWAISDSMDLEINPQIRTDRSVGLYGTFRFVDSPISFGQLRVGYFKDKASYAREHRLPEDKHYGLQFVYNRNEVLAKRLGEHYQDGLYADITLLNDIDYLNLQKSGGFGIFGQSPIQQSILNYYLKNNRWYAGINAKYFIDTRRPDNDATLQNLPNIQLHKFLDRIVWDNLTYSLDVQFRNLYRKTGVDSKQFEMRVPFEWTFSFLDDYFNITAGESLYFGKFYFDNDDTLRYDTFTYANNTHYVKLFSDLTAKLGSYYHVIQPSVTYQIPGNESAEPVSVSELLSKEEQVKSLFSVGLPEKALMVGFNQYLYDEHMKLVFFQRLMQHYYPDRSYTTGELENEMGYYWNQWKLYNYLIYSFEFSDIKQSSSYLSYRDDTWFASIGHTYKQILQSNVSSVVSNDIQLDFRYAWNERINLNGRWNYDLENHGLERWLFGVGYHRDCWSIDASVGADIRPRPTAVDGSVDFIQEYSFYLQLSFVPFGSINTSMLDSMFNQDEAF